MMVRLSDLRCREVINVSDGGRIGFVCDVELDCTGGNVVALVVPGKMKLFGLLGREDDFVIPWNAIRRMGSDIILVEVNLEQCRTPCKKKRRF
jgi:YlmC/YmxH family sporulation protein